MRTLGSVPPLATLALALLSPLLAAGCGGGRVPYRLVGVQPVYTLTNLHPDGNRGRLYSTNYQQGGLIPVCTPVVIDVVSAKKAIFRDATTGEQYEYLFDRRHMQKPIEAHLDQYFGSDCKKEYMSSMSPIDQQGIAAGQALPGMTREAVIVALGYPPPHESNVHGNEWRYWNNRWSSFVVVFNGEVVQEVRE